MSEHYDPLETREPAERDRALFARLPAAIAHAMTAPGWARHLKGVEPKAIDSRAALAKLPLLRKSDLPRLQKEHPPFGGFNAIAPGKARRLHMSPGPIFEPQYHDEDFAAAARALFAAGFRPGDIVHNSFSYHLTPVGHILEDGAHHLGCATIPGGIGHTEQQLEAIGQFRPSGYIGTADYIKILLDGAARMGRDVSSLKRGLVSGAALPASLHAELARRGVDVKQCYAISETGVIAYESEARKGMIVSESLIVEIVVPGTGAPVAEGEVGEVVVTSFNAGYPMVRLATGDLSAVMPGSSPCGRSNIRIKGWMGRADQATKIKGMFVHPAQVLEIVRRHPELKRARLVVARADEKDVMVLRAESDLADRGLADAVAATLQSLTKLKGEVELAPPGSLPNDGKVISDERGTK
jgi:phenylacetate-CoA ligase